MKAIIIFVSAIMAALTTILISGFRKYCARLWRIKE